MDSKLEARYHDEAKNIHAKLDENCGSIIAILMIISIIISILRLLNSCSGKKARDFRDMRDTPIARNRLAKIVASEIGLVNYKKYGHQVVNAIVERGVEMREESLQELVDTIE